MPDVLLEDRLRAALRAEGDALPFSITIDELELRLRDRRQRRRVQRRGWLVAAAAIVALTGVAGVALRDQAPTVTSGAPRSDDVIPRHVLWQWTDPVLSAASDFDIPTADQTTPWDTVIGELPPGSVYELGYKCVGEGTVTFAVGSAASDPAPCNGLPYYTTFTTPGGQAQTLRIRVHQHAAWRVVAGLPPAEPPAVGFPADLTAAEELLALAGPGAPFILASERAADVSLPDAPVDFSVGSFGADHAAEVLWDCSGPGSFAIAWLDEGTGKPLGRFATDACRGPAEAVTLADLPPTVRLMVTTAPSVGWRLIVVEPQPSTGVSPTAPLRDTPASFAAEDAGWTRTVSMSEPLSRASGPSGSRGAATGQNHDRHSLPRPPLVIAAP